MNTIKMENKKFRKKSYTISKYYTRDKIINGEKVLIVYMNKACIFKSMDLIKNRCSNIKQVVDETLLFLMPPGSGERIQIGVIYEEPHKHKKRIKNNLYAI